MHGVRRPIGLDVLMSVSCTNRCKPGGVMTVEPAIYIRKEKFALPLENTVVIGEDKNIDLMEPILIEADEVEALMNS